MIIIKSNLSPLSSSKTSSPFTKEDEAVFFILGIHAQVDPRQHDHPTKNYEDDDDDGNNYDHDNEAQIAFLCCEGIKRFMRIKERSQ